MKIIKVLLPASVIAALMITIIIFITDQDPKTTLVAQVKDFVGLTLALSALLSVVGLLSYNGVLFTKNLFRQGRK